MPSKNAVLQIENVTVGYAGQPILSDISFDIKSGEFFGLMGLNGAGKTTLIKSILGLRNQASGHISVFGNRAGEKKAKENLAYLPERFEPPWFLKGIEFIEFSLSLYGQKMSRSAIRQEAEKLALDPLVLNKRVQTYSKGMRQKLGLLATIFTNCPLLILDEPMSGLDPMARALVKNMLQQCRNNGQTVFLSSHILSDMDALCDRVIVVDQGIIKFAGTPKALKEEGKDKTLESAFLNLIKAA